MLHAVVMAGGSGTRFWPLSRTSKPKQFLRLGSERSLIQRVLDRCPPMVVPERFWVVTNAALVEQVAEHLPEVPACQIIPEPYQRNTAPCIGLAALFLSAQDPEAVMLVMPADHIIAPAEKLQECVESAVEIVHRDPDRLVLLGIQPTSPATGYGYIEQGSEISAGIFEVESFREKPDATTAESYLDAGRFLWNSGIFIWRAATILKCIEQHQPEIWNRLRRLKSAIGAAGWTDVLAQEFAEMPSISIDYAVLEYETRIAVVRADFEWDDVGSWEAMTRLHGADQQGNTVIGNACLIDASENIIYSTTGHVVALYGIRNCMIVQTQDATLVADRSDENAIRKLVAALEEQGYDDIL